jgi:hypothetical protein
MILKPFFVVPYQPTSIVWVNPPVAGYPASNLGEFNHVGLESRISSVANNLIADLGSAKDINFLGLLSTNAAPSSLISWILSNSSTFATVIHSEPSQPIRTPAATNYSERYHEHREIASVINARYVLAAIDPASGVEFSAAHIIIGKKIEFSRFYNKGHGMGSEDFGSFEMTANGIPNITDGAILRTLKFDMSNLTKAEFMLKYQPLIAAVKTTKPVYICFDPQADEYRQSNTYFGWLKPPGFATIGEIKPGAYSQSFEMLSQI